MRLAIAFFGIPRGHRVTAPSLESIINVLAKTHDVSIHYHLFKLRRVLNPRSDEDGEIMEKAYEWFAQFDGDIEQPNSPTIEAEWSRLSSFGDEFNDNFKTLKNLTHQLHALRKVTVRAASYNPDAVIFMRPDLIYHDHLPESAIAAVRFNQHLCCLPEWQWWGGVNDRFAICGQTAYRAYGCRADLALEFCSTYKSPLSSEGLLAYSLRKDQVSLRTMRTRASRVRVDNQIQMEPFDAIQTLGGGKRLRVKLLRAQTLPFWLPFL